MFTFRTLYQCSTLLMADLFSASEKRIFFRRIFSISGSWEPELTNSIRKDIEDHWREKINLPEGSEEGKQKYYVLSMFPYPSGKLHMGHVRIYSLSDALARYHRMRGKKVIHPVGWDAFGLPAENAAIKKRIHPAVWTANNVEAMRKQFKLMNLSFDWDRELSTCDPSYYKWTQYFFLLMYEKGLAYKKGALVNWDPIDQTVLADEQVDENDCSWRSGCKVEKRRLEQWFFRTTAYCKSLYDGLSSPNLVEWREVKKIQREWIGQCTGYTMLLKVCHKGIELSQTLPVWTETPELLFGATFVVISHENHFNCEEWGSGSTENEDRKLPIEAVHPLTGAMMPIFISSSLDFISATDSVLVLPGNEDEKLLNFARKHNMDLMQVVDDTTKVLINSEEFSGMNLLEAKERILDKIKQRNITVYQSSRKLRDWLISRQRYWGTPIPVINCPVCKVVPVPTSDIPVMLPHIEELAKSGNPLKEATDWLNVKCPKCGADATRETETMDTFVDSSWYFMRYLDVNNQSEPFNVKKVNKEMPVDLYIGGIEHAALHLLYARFMSHFCHSIDMLQSPEPFSQLLMQGMIHGQSYCIKESRRYIPKEEVDFSGKEPVEKSSGFPVIVQWEKMSKSKFNGVDPEEVLSEYGIDTTRLFILGNVAPQSPRRWNDDLFHGIIKWQRRIWLTVSDFLEQKKGTEKAEVKKIDQDKFKEHEKFLWEGKNYYVKGANHNFLTTRQLSVAISKLQGLTADLRAMPKCLYKESLVYEETLAALLIMLAPLAPHFAAELWSAFSSVAVGGKNYDLSKPVFHQKFPEVDEDYNMLLDIRLNGMRFDAIPLPKKKLFSLDEKSAINLAMTSKKLQEALQNLKVSFIKYKPKPEFDTEINVIYIPPKKKKKNATKISDDGE